MSAAVTVATQPLALLSVAIATYYASSPKLLSDSLTNFAGTTSIISPLVNYIIKHLQQFVGFLALSGAALSAGSRNTAITIVATSAVLAFFVLKPNTNVWQYSFLGILASLFLRFKDERERLIVIGILVVSIMYGFISFQLDPTFMQA